MPLPTEDFLKLLLSAEPDLRAFIGSLVAKQDARDDVFQEVALTLWRQSDSYDATKPFGAWARGIAAKKILQRRSADARFPAAFGPEAIAAIVEAFDRGAARPSPRADALEECLQSLSPKSTELLQWRYLHDWDAPRIASHTGRSLDAVYQALSRVRAALAACIEQRLAGETA